MKEDTPAVNQFVEPMMALRVRELPVGHWIYEMKFDGYRALAFRVGSEVRLLSRNRAFWLSGGAILRGWARSASGDTAKGLTWIEDGIDCWIATGAVP